MDWRSVCASACGKVLITGGYLVLNEQHSGLVLATSARFYTDVKVSASKHWETVKGSVAIAVESPQFAQCVYGCLVHENGAFRLQLDDQSNRNAYIEETIVCVMNGLLGLENKKMLDAIAALQDHRVVTITLRGDNDFYSQVQRLQQQTQPLSRASLSGLPKFLPPHLDVVDGKQVASKTGMGSSAALVTSLVAAMYMFFKQPCTLEIDDKSRERIHNLAQLSHCFVQRKVGSGFDVSAACFGSQRYTRFPSSIVSSFCNVSDLLPQKIAECVQNTPVWDIMRRITPFRLPRGMRLMMGDISGGSATVSMVRSVTKWQRENPDDASQIVTSLSSYNEEVEAAFAILGTFFGSADSEVQAARVQMATMTASEWSRVHPDMGAALNQLRSAFLGVRQRLREMGSAANVPIEPPEQTELLDATMALPGVVIAGVPGAGGYDAIFVVTVDESVTTQVERKWLEWSSNHANVSICPLLCDAYQSNQLELVNSVDG